MRNGRRLSILLMTLGLVLTGCSNGAKTSTAAPELLEPIAVAENTIIVEKQDFYSAVYIDVTVVPQIEELYFTMDGEILDIEVTEGQMVKKGDVLARVDQTLLNESIKELQETIAYEENIYSMQLDQADLDVQIAKVQLEKLQSEYDEQELKKAEEEARKKAEEEARKKAEEEAQKKAEESSAVNGTEGAEESSMISTGDSAEESSMISTEESSEGVNSAETQGEESSSGTSVQDDSDLSGKEESVKSQNEITTYDLQQAKLVVQEAELTYNQLLDNYNQKMSQRQSEMQSLLDKVGEDTIYAAFSGRVVQINVNVGDYVRQYDTVMLLVNEEVRLLQGSKYSNTLLSRADNLDVLIDGTAYQVSYIPYDEDEYLKKSVNNESLPSWFELEETAEVSFGESGTVRMYRDYSIDTLVVPASCVQSDDLGDYVYKAEDGQRIKTYVTIGISTGSFAEIVDGLNEGDEVYDAE